jgi:hypothetical protein
MLVKIKPNHERRLIGASCVPTLMIGDYLALVISTNSKRRTWEGDAHYELDVTRLVVGCVLIGCRNTSKLPLPEHEPKATPERDAPDPELILLYSFRFGSMT